MPPRMYALRICVIMLSVVCVAGFVVSRLPPEQEVRIVEKYGGTYATQTQFVISEIPEGEYGLFLERLMSDRNIQTRGDFRSQYETPLYKVDFKPRTEGWCCTALPVPLMKLHTDTNTYEIIVEDLFKLPNAELADTIFWFNHFHPRARQSGYYYPWNENYFLVWSGDGRYVVFGKKSEINDDVLGYPIDRPQAPIYYIDTHNLDKGFQSLSTLGTNGDELIHVAGWSIRGDGKNGNDIRAFGFSSKQHIDSFSWHKPFTDVYVLNFTAWEFKKIFSIPTDEGTFEILTTGTSTLPVIQHVFWKDENTIRIYTLPKSVLRECENALLRRDKTIPKIGLEKCRAVSESNFHQIKIHDVQF